MAFESTESERQVQRRRLLGAGVAMVATFACGTLGFYLMGAGDWTVIHSAYMTMVTLSTVGYGEVIPISGFADRELFTMVLLFFGMGTILYFVSTLSAFIIEGDLAHIVRRRRLEKLLQSISGHYIVCGAGRSGSVALELLIEAGHRVVVIDRDESLLERLRQQLGRNLLYVLGDATDDECLVEARIDSARGLITALTEDRDNLYVTFTARQLSSSVRIVSKSLSDPDKITRAGADSVVALNAIGGRRLYSELVQPHMAHIVDGMLLDRTGLTVEEFVIPHDCVLNGHTLAEAKTAARANVLIAAVQPPGEAQFEYNPCMDLVLMPGLLVVAMGPAAHLSRLNAVLLAPPIDTAAAESGSSGGHGFGAVGPEVDYLR